MVKLRGYRYFNDYSKRFFMALSITGVYFAYLIVMVFFQQDIQTASVSTIIYAGACLAFYVLFIITYLIAYPNIIRNQKLNSDLVTRILCEIGFVLIALIADAVLMYDLAISDRSDEYNSIAMCGIFAQTSIYPGTIRSAVIVATFCILYAIVPAVSGVKWHLYISEAAEIVIIGIMGILINYYYERLDSSEKNNRRDLMNIHAQLSAVIKSNNTFIESIAPPQYISRIRQVILTRQSMIEEIDMMYMIVIDMVNFTSMSHGMSSDKLSLMMNSFFVKFDECITRVDGAYKVKHIGDAVQAFVLEDSNAAVYLASKLMTCVNGLQFRCGIGAGKGSAIIIGKTLVCFDVVGEAKRRGELLESKSLPGRILVDAEIALTHPNGYEYDQTECFSGVWACFLKSVPNGGHRINKGIFPRESGIGRATARKKFCIPKLRSNVHPFAIIVNFVANTFILLLHFYIVRRFSWWYHVSMAVNISILGTASIFAMFIPWISFVTALCTIVSIYLSGEIHRQGGVFMTLFLLTYSIQLPFASPIDMIVMAASATIPALIVFDTSITHRVAFGLMLCVTLSSNAISYYKRMVLEGTIRALNERKKDLVLESGNTDMIVHSFIPRGYMSKTIDTFTATVVFINIVDVFTDDMKMQDDVKTLHELFSAYDNLMIGPLVKVKSNGAQYIFFSTAEDPVNMKSFIGLHEKIKYGLHKGPVTSIIVGERKRAFDIYGETVNIAARLANVAPTGRGLTVSGGTEFKKMNLKGIGECMLYFD